MWTLLQVADVTEMFVTWGTKSVLAAYFMQICDSNASIDGIYFEEKGLQFFANNQLFSFQWLNWQIRKMKQCLQKFF
jgi:hypothetical protein